ncbi:MAG TPA: cysteine desulfurase NifS [Thermodesulfobacteriota bacterium]
MSLIYLDYNATTPMDPRALESMIPYMREYYGNPSSIHSYGSKAKAALDESRERVSELIRTKPKEIVFTSGGSESNNSAIIGAAFALKEKGNHLITTEIEHASILETFRFLGNHGFKLTLLGVDHHGLIDLDELRESITDETILVSVMFANNETGVVMPINEIAALVKEKGIIFHTDAIQALGKMDINLNDISVDMLSVSSHKIYGPKGVGAIYIKTGLRIDPFIHGGGQERGRRSGTENVPAIVGFGKACEIVKEELKSQKSEVRIKGMRDRLHNGITDKIDCLKLNGHPEKRLPNTLNLSFEDVEGESLVINLDLEGIAVSTGSACSEGNVDPSHVLLAMGLSKQQASSSIRFSFGRFNEEKDVDRVLEVLPRIVERIRQVKKSELVKKISA